MFNAEAARAISYSFIRQERVDAIFDEIKEAAKSGMLYVRFGLMQESDEQRIENNAIVDMLKNVGYSVSKEGANKDCMWIFVGWFLPE